MKGEEEEVRSEERGDPSPLLPLCRSVLYEALSLGFSPPTPATLSRLTTADSLAALGDAAAVLDAELGPGTKLAALLGALDRELEEPSRESLDRRYSTLFGHTGRGLVPPYETEYGDDTLFQKPQEMADLAGFFMAFGLVVDPRQHERIDHVSCELEFLSFLARKEAHAVECGDEPMRLETRRATRLFLRDHLGRFVSSFTRRIMRADPDGLYGRLGSLCLELVTADCRCLKVALGPEMLRLRLPTEDRAPMACGRADACGMDPDGPDRCG